MNPEFQTWLKEAGVSELGVKLKKQESDIAALVAKGDAATADDLTKAEALDVQNEAIKAEQLARKEAKGKLEKLGAKNTQRTSNGDGSLKLPTETLGDAGTPGHFATAKRIGKLKSFHGDREILTRSGHKAMLTADERAYRFGIFMLGAIAGNEVTRRHYQQQAADMGFEYLTMNEGTVGAGGYLVPPEFSPDFIYLQQFYGIAQKYARNVTVTSNDYRQNRMQSGVTVAWEGELATIATSGMTIDQVQVLLKRISGLFPVSNELNADAVISVVDWLVKDAMRQIEKKKDEAFFNGDGTLAFGNTVGVIPGLLAVGSATVTPLQGTSTTWAAVIRSDIEKLMGALPEFPGMDPKLFCSNAYYRNVLRPLAINAGGTNLLMLEQGSSGGKFMGIKQWDGTEVVISQVLPTTDPGTGTVSLLYGDPEFSSTIVTKGEYTIFQANQGDNMVAQNFSQIRIDERVGIVNHELGSSTLAGAMVGLKSN